tara:strand:- start:3 stop:599 length:597 start_codon:yes stop_codon:yes gene_type:complete
MSKGKRLGKLKGRAYGARQMAGAVARRAMIEADVELKETGAILGGISSALGATIDIQKTREQFRTAKRGGYEGSLMSFLTNKEEAGEAILRGERAKSISDETFYDVNTNTFKDVSSDINDRFGGTMESLYQTIQSTEEQLGRILIGQERQDVIESAPFQDFVQEQDMALREYRSMGIDIDNILGLRQERRGIFGRLRR